MAALTSISLADSHTPAYTARSWIYTVGHKTCHQTFVHIFTKYWPIFKILSLLQSWKNLRVSDYPTTP